MPNQIIEAPAQRANVAILTRIGFERRRRASRCHRAWSRRWATRSIRCWRARCRVLAEAATRW